MGYFFGSGNWQRTNTKRTVETCLQLDITDFISTGNLEPGKSGIAIWGNSELAHQRQSVSFEVSLNPHSHLFLKLGYNFPGLIEVRQQIQVCKKQITDGRIYHRFVCPLAINATTCNSCVTKLYLNERYFGCRRCLNLTYLSCQQAHREKRLLQKIVGLNW